MTRSIRVVAVLSNLVLPNMEKVAIGRVRSAPILDGSLETRVSKMDSTETTEVVDGVLVQSFQCDAPLMHICTISSKKEAARKAQLEEIAVKVFHVLNQALGWTRDHLKEVHKLARKIQEFGDCAIRVFGVCVDGVLYNESISLVGHTYDYRRDDCSCCDKECVGVAPKKSEVFYSGEHFNKNRPNDRLNYIRALLKNNGIIRLKASAAGGLRGVLKHALSIEALHMSAPMDFSKLIDFFSVLSNTLEKSVTGANYIGIGIGTDYTREAGNLFLRIATYATGIECDKVSQIFEEAKAALKGYSVGCDINLLHVPVRRSIELLTLADESFKELVLKIRPGSTEPVDDQLGIIRPVALRPQDRSGRSSCSRLDQ